MKGCEIRSRATQFRFWLRRNFRDTITFSRLHAISNRFVRLAYTTSTDWCPRPPAQGPNAGALCSPPKRSSPQPTVSSMEPLGRRKLLTSDSLPGLWDFWFPYNWSNLSTWTLTLFDVLITMTLLAELYFVV